MELVTSRDGTRIAFWRSGAGPPLLLVHGATADHIRWQVVLSALDSRFRVCAMDRRGRGGSSDSPAYELAREAEDIIAVVEALDEPVDVLGHSYGALCAIEASLRTSVHPEVSALRRTRRKSRAAPGRLGLTIGHRKPIHSRRAILT